MLMRLRPARIATVLGAAVLFTAFTGLPAAADPQPKQLTDCFNNPITAALLPSVIFVQPTPGTRTTTFGTSGNDIIIGTNGPNFINGRGGDDIICGGGGDDVLYGGDNAEGGTDADHIDGEAGADEIHGQGDDDIIYGGKGNDTLYGDELTALSNGNDSLHGEEDNDYLVCAGGATDYADGGTTTSNGAPDNDGPTSGHGCEAWYNVP